MITFDNQGNILMFSDKDKKKKGFFKKHWKGLLAGGVGALGAGALAYAGIKNKDKLGALMDKFKKSRSNDTQAALDGKVKDVDRQMEILRSTGQEGNKEYKALEKEKAQLEAAKRGDIGSLGYNEHDADHYIHGGY